MLKTGRKFNFEKRKSPCLHFCCSYSEAKLTAGELTGRGWMLTPSGLSVTGFMSLFHSFQTAGRVTLSRLYDVTPVVSHRLSVLSRSGGSRPPPLHSSGVHWRRSCSTNRQMPKKEKAVNESLCKVNTAVFVCC